MTPGPAARGTDRVTHGYPGPFPDANIRDFESDAGCALVWLAAQPETERTRMWFVGHGLGGTIVPETLTQRQLAAGGAMLGAPSSSPELWMRRRYDARRAFLIAKGQNEEDVDALLAPEHQVCLDLEALKAGTFAGEMIDGRATTAWLEWMNLPQRTLSMVAGLRKPLLALHGEADTDVDAVEFEAWDAAFALSEFGPRTAVRLPCVSHAMNCLSETDPRLFEPEDADPSVDSAVIDALAGMVLGEESAD